MKWEEIKEAINGISEEHKKALDIMASLNIPYNEEVVQIIADIIGDDAKGLDVAFEQVQEFHTAFGHIVRHEPTAVTLDIALPRQIWKAEEIVEYLHATVAGDKAKFGQAVNDLITGILDAQEKQEAKGIEYATELDIIVGQVDALTDINYFNQGDFVVGGVNSPQSLMDIVQNANMGKLHKVNGKLVPKYREDGKVMKPDNWERDFAPEEKIRELIKGLLGK